MIMVPYKSPNNNYNILLQHLVFDDIKIQHCLLQIITKILFIIIITHIYFYGIIYVEVFYMKKLFLILFVTICSICILSINTNLLALELEQDFNSAKCIAIDKLDTSEFNESIIDGFNHDSRFYLFEAIPIGYLLYDRIVGIYLEYSKEDHSPYYGINGRYIYITPTYYYHELDGIIYDTHLNTIVDTETLLLLKEFDLDNLNQMLLAKEQEEHQEEPLHGKHLKNVPINNTPHIECCPPTGAVPYSFYYENLKGNKGSNFDGSPYEGSCSFVAVEMMLSYYDTVYNQNIIPVDRKARGSNISYFPTYYSISPSLFSQSPGIIDQYHEDLINNTGVGNSMSVSEAMNVCGNILSSILGVPNSILYFDQWTYLSLYDKPELIKMEITKGGPVFVRIDPLSSNYQAHAVVAYEYDSTDIYANYGWMFSNQHTALNYDVYKIIHSAFSFSFSLQHIHSFSYDWQGVGGYTGTVCICGLKTCNHEHHSYYGIDSDCHNVDCGFCYSTIGCSYHSYNNGV